MPYSGKCLWGFTFRYGEPSNGNLTHENLYIQIVAADSIGYYDMLRAYNENKTAILDFVQIRRVLHTHTHTHPATDFSYQQWPRLQGAR